jgi:hypothetical protein
MQGIDNLHIPDVEGMGNGNRESKDAQVQLVRLEGCG